MTEGLAEGRGPRGSTRPFTHELGLGFLCVRSGLSLRGFRRGFSSIRD